MSTILFNTANLVARVTNYRFRLADWGAQEKKTIETTDESEFAAICQEINAAGYDAIELWIAHCHPSRVSIQEAKARRAIAKDHGLTIECLACAYTEANLRIAEALEVKSINGGFWGTDLASVSKLIAGSNIAFHYENHPEKTPEDILAAIGGGNDKIGVTLDTGWVGSAGTVGVEAFITKLGKQIRHVHLKDVAARGGHECVKLGTGVAGIDTTIRLLKAQGYSGMWSWEDEPENRNPMDIAAEMRRYIAERINR